MEKTKTETRENGDVTTYKYKDGLLVGAVTEIKTGGRIRFTIANPERIEAAVENFHKSQLEKMRLQNDETLSIYEKFSQKRRA